MMATPLRISALAICLPLSSIAALGEADPGRAADSSASLRPSVIDEAIIERASTGVWGFIINAPVDEDDATVTAPCPLVTPDEFGWFMEQQRLSPNLNGWAVSVFFEWNVGGAPGIRCGVDTEAHLDQVGQGAPHGATIEAMVLPSSATFNDVLAIAEGAAIIGAGSPEIGGEIGGVCYSGDFAICIAMWHRSGLVLNTVLAGPIGDVTQDRAVSLLSSMIETMVAGLAEQANATAPGGPTTIQVATTSASPMTAPVAVSTTTAPTIPATTPPPASLVDRLPPVAGYAYQQWSDARVDAFLAGPFTPDDLDAYVAEFAGIDVARDGRVIGWIELHLLRSEFHSVPNLDEVVLDTLSGYPYSPGPSTVERLSLAGEEILVRRTPSLVAWTWHEDGIVFNVVADGIDPGEAGDFVVALSALSFGDTAVSAAASPTTTPPAVPVPAPAPTRQPTGLGTDPRMDLLAIACFNGTMQSCDDLYDESPVGSAYETFGDTCAGRQPAATDRYCAEVFIDTVVQPTSPATTPMPADSVLASTTVPSPPPVPPTDPDLASRILTMDGYSVAEMPADDPLWRLFDDSLPVELTRHHARVVGADGVPVAHLVVAGAAGDRPAIDAFVEHTFADDVFLPAGSVETDDGGVFTTMNSAVPVWTEMEGSAVIVAEQEIDGNFQWAWSAADAVWIVRGTADAEAYVRALLRLHAASLDPYDQQGMTGDLFDHTPTVPGFQYWDRPRVSTVASVSQTLLGDCVERFYIGYVLPEGVSGEGNDPDDLHVTLIKAAGRCVERDLLEEVVADVASAPGVRTDEIGGLTVYRDEQNAIFTEQGVQGMIALVGDVVITLATQSPQTFVDMAPFIEQFLAGQPR